MKKVVLHLSSILTVAVILSGILAMNFTQDIYAVPAEKLLKITVDDQNGKHVSGISCLIMLDSTTNQYSPATGTDGKIHQTIPGDTTMATITCFGPNGDVTVFAPTIKHTTEVAITLL